MDRTAPYQAWTRQQHAELFGGWNRYPLSRLLQLCDQFNECQLFRSLIGATDCNTLSDVGCATGRFYRYFRELWPSLEYKGFDISEAAIDHARTVFPGGDFSTFDGHVKSLTQIASDIVFCRDVVHHQTNPYEFLSDLYDVTRSYLILRVRTRDEGATVLDVDRSGQYTYGEWVPYIVLNTSELVDRVRSFRPAPASITVWMHPIVLGGHTSRFLPKELYYPETGTAETALLIQKTDGSGKHDTVVTMETRPETGLAPHDTRRRHIGLRLARKIHRVTKGLPAFIRNV